LDWTAARNKKNFPINTPGGIPPNDSSANVIINANTGLRRLKPAKSAMVSLPVALLKRITTVKANRLENTYMNM
jgi:hypothetical protein